jgi:serine/threonine protein phosphatase PrpC
VTPFIRAYAANSHRGLVKPFNEDRLSIVPKLSPIYEDISIFAVYDGHGGSGCADYLKENIPRLILK